MSRNARQRLLLVSLGPSLLHTRTAFPIIHLARYSLITSLVFHQSHLCTLSSPLSGLFCSVLICEVLFYQTSVSVCISCYSVFYLISCIWTWTLNSFVNLCYLPLTFACLTTILDCPCHLLSFCRLVLSLIPSLINICKWIRPSLPLRHSYQGKHDNLLCK